MWIGVERCVGVLRRRVVVSMLVGVACGLATWGVALDPRYHEQDFGVWWLAARVLRAGGNPYEAVRGVGGLIDGVRIFYYPLPSVLAVWPLSLFPSAQVAAGIFIGLSAGILAFALTARAWWPLLMLLSGPMLNSITTAQWAPLVTAGVLLPSLAWLGVLKPNIGLSILAHRWSWRAVAIMAVIGVASLLVMPRWPLAFIENAGHSPYHFSAVTAPWGLLLCAVALCRWKRADARLWLTLALVPTSPTFSDTLPLLTIATSRAELIALMLPGLAGFAWLAQRSFVYDAGYMPLARSAVLWLAYVPALLLVLCRPNVAASPRA
jgi:hypothetical protein